MSTSSRCRFAMSGIADADCVRMTAAAECGQGKTMSTSSRQMGEHCSPLQSLILHSTPLLTIELIFYCNSVAAGAPTAR